MAPNVYNMYTFFVSMFSHMTASLTPSLSHSHSVAAVLGTGWLNEPFHITMKERTTTTI